MYATILNLDRTLSLLQRNEWSWTRLANVLWVEQPVGVSEMLITPRTTSASSCHRPGFHKEHRILQTTMSSLHRLPDSWCNSLKCLRSWKDLTFTSAVKVWALFVFAILLLTHMPCSMLDTVSSLAYWRLSQCINMTPHQMFLTLPTIFTNIPGKSISTWKVSGSRILHSAGILFSKKFLLCVSSRFVSAETL